MSLSIRTLGHGPRPLVLIHGWAMHGDVLAPLANALAAHYTLHLVDLPGHGRSRHSSVPLELAACAEAIAAATPPAVWLGWSLGGLIALHGALYHAGHVKGLAMLAATPCFVQRRDWTHAMPRAVLAQFKRGLAAHPDATLDRFLALQTMGARDPRGDLRRLRAQVLVHGRPDTDTLAQGLHLLESTDLRAQIDALRVPSVWVGGSGDRLLPWQAMAWAANACGGAFSHLGEAGHAPFVGAAKTVADALQPLLDPETA